MKKIGESAQLAGTQSLRFELGTAPTRFGPIPIEGFAIRTADGVARAYLNVCPHRGRPVDLGDGQLFAKDGTLECQAHGAYFDPATGVCVHGACPGRALKALAIVERDGELLLEDEREEPVADPE